MLLLLVALRARFRWAVHRACIACAARLQGCRPGCRDRVVHRRRAGPMPAAAGVDCELNLDSTYARPAFLLALVITLDRILSAPRCGAHVGGCQR